MLIPVTWLVFFAYIEVTNGNTFSQLSGTEAWAWANLLLGLSIVAMPLASLLLGVIAKTKIRRSHGSQKGKGLAVIAIGWFVALLAAVAAVSAAG